MRLICILLVAITLYACKNDKVGTSADTATVTDENTVINVNKPEEKVVKKVETTSFDPALPEACDLVSKEFLAQQLGTAAENVSLKNASKASSGNAKSCFFRWPSNFPNTGMFIQVQTNPFPEEAPDFHKMFIEAKKTQGEQMINSETPVVYADWPNIGDDAAYSFEAQKYVWRVGNDFSYLLAFNTDMTETQQKRIARSIAQEILKNQGI